MKYPVYVVRDTKVGFDPQFLVQINEASAVRGFEYMMSNPQSIQNKFPSDYELYHVFDYDTESGVCEPLNPPKFIINGGAFNAKQER